MANQAIALGIRAPQPIDLGAATARFGNAMNQMAQMEAFKQEAAAKQFDREQKRALSAAYASSVNPQTGEIDQAALLRNLQTSGLGNAIPGAMEDLAKTRKAGAEAKSSDLSYIKSFNDGIIEELKGALSVEQAISSAARLKARFPDLGGKVDEVMKSLPQDPAQFGAWREEQLFHSLDADKQLTRELTTQNLGTSTRVIETAKYRPGAAATVVSGSEAAIAPDLKPVTVEGLGVVGYNPATNTYTPATGGGVTVGAGIPSPRVGGGSVASALQTNPGALKDGAFARSQPGYKGASGGFATFETPQQGVAAQEKLLQSRYLGRGLNTVDKIINTYAPQGPENSAASVRNYKSYIAQRAGVNVNQPLSARDIPSVASAMREFETGQRPGGGGGAAAPVTTEQAASAAEKQRKAKIFQDITGVNLKTGDDPIAAIIKGSTSGLVEMLGAEFFGALPEQFGGGATKGMENIGALETLASTLTLAFAPGGRLSTGVSNEDRAKIEQQLGRIEDPMVPAGKRLAAWREVKNIMSRLLGVNPASKTTQPAPKRMKYDPVTGKIS